MRPPLTARRSTRATRATRSIVLLLLAAGGGPFGCSSVGTPTPGGTLRGGGAANPAAELERLEAAQQRAQLGARERGEPPAALPGSLDLPSLHEIADEPDARLALGAALTEIARKRPPDGAAQPAGPADAEAADTALRRYAAGRLEFEAGRYTAAITQLEAGTRLDPSSARLWEALGEAQLRAGLARPGSESLARAVALGSRTPATLLALARAAQRQGDHAEGAVYLAMLAPEGGWGAGGGQVDPALPSVIDTLLGESLVSLGYLNAGAEAIARGLGLPRSFASPTIYYEELGEVYRRRSDLWRLVGDTRCRLGEYESALTAYESAAGFPSLEPGAILPRRVYASLRQGRPAGAARAIYEELAAEDGPRRLESRHLVMIRELARFDPATGAALSGAILAERDGRTPPLADSLRGRLTRAAAAAAGEEQAAEILRARLAENPLDTETLTRLLSLGTGEADRAGAARTLESLVRRAPLAADTIAGELARPGMDAAAPGSLPASALLAELESSGRSVESRMLLASLRSFAGDAEGAAGIVESLRRERSRDMSVAALATAVASRIGRWDLAEAALRQLESDPATPPAVMARALASFQRLGPALEAMEGAVKAGAGVVPAADLLLAAELAAGLGKRDEQERYLRLAIDADPYNEAAHERLIRLLKDGDGSADAVELTEAVRRLREAAPSGRVLRLLRAEEYMGVGRVALGQRDLLALAQETPLDPAPLESLVQGWLLPRFAEPASRAAFASAAPALEQMIEGNPTLPWPQAARVVLAALTSEASAAQMLAETGPAAGDPPAAAAAIEEALRRAGRGEEADERAAARLASAPPGIDTTVQLVAALARRGEFGRAAGALGERLPAGVVLTAAQTSMLLDVVERETRSAATSMGDIAGAAELLGRVLEMVPSAPVTLHAVRLTMLAGMVEVSIDAVLEAADLAVLQHPDQHEAVYQATAARLAERDRLKALEFLERAIGRAAARGENADPSLYRQWVVWAVMLGEPEEAVRVTRAAIEAEMTPFILPPDLEDPAGAEPPAPADLAYQLGMLIASEGPERDATAVALYELAVELDADHAMASNNLGYMLLERDGPSERAEGLLERAFALLPEQPSVIDSLAWLRYKQGVLTDELDAEGAVVRRGAVPLLVRALEIAGDANPVITDHLGDALWALGDRARAVNHWKLVEEQARRKISAIRRSNAPEGAAVAQAIQRLRVLMRAAQAKQTAVLRGRKPAIAPIPGREFPEPGVLPAAPPQAPELDA